MTLSRVLFITFMNRIGVSGRPKTCWGNYVFQASWNTRDGRSGRAEGSLCVSVSGTAPIAQLQKMIPYIHPGHSHSSTSIRE